MLTMSDTVDKGYDRWSIPLKTACSCSIPMTGPVHYANYAHIYFYKPLTSQLQTRITLDPKLQLITSDRVVTETSNLDLEGKKTWGVY